MYIYFLVYTTLPYLDIPCKVLNYSEIMIKILADVGWFQSLGPSMATSQRFAFKNLIKYSTNIILRDSQTTNC